MVLLYPEGFQRVWSSACTVTVTDEPGVVPIQLSPAPRKKLGPSKISKETVDTCTT